VTENVIEKGTRDAKKTATARETGIANDGTPVRLFSVTIAFVIPDDNTVPFLITARSRRGGGGGGGGDHWEPEDRERRNEVRFLVPVLLL
jgi:hypothetical protein